MAIDIEVAYRRYGPMVVRRCRALLNDQEQAVDAMHDVFVRLMRSGDRLDDRGMSSLLYRIATNVSSAIVARESDAAVSKAQMRL